MQSLPTKNPVMADKYIGYQATKGASTDFNLPQSTFPGFHAYIGGHIEKYNK